MTHKDFNYDDWDDQYGEPDIELVEFDRFIKSDLYRQICDDADDGDEDSITAMDTISEMLVNICWHLENKSPQHRISYEINMITNYVKGWGEYE